MAVERNILVSILKLTKSGPVAKEIVAKDANVPTQVTEELLKKFRDAELIEWKNEMIEASSNQRVKIAVHAIKLGADFERVCKVLEWIEFENLAATAFEVNNFIVKRRFRFKWAQRKWEIDVLGCREPIIACVDCKHWSHGWRESAIKKAVEAQALRTKVLAEALPSLQKGIGLVQWRQATLIPVVLSLVPGPLKFYNNVPIVPILQLQNFLEELPAHVTSLIHFAVCFSECRQGAIC
jgi:Holliday junction resolvase-like predicted endonuclease/predicted transcriptional regulator